ncbi:MAG: PAS domain S-box protein [Gammaproteobacteria bacterium]|nr:PAS domain S-box protein [Gammaproteobacteria bacterium]
MTPENQNTDRPPPLLRRFLRVFMPLCLLLVAIGISHYYTAMKLARISLESSEHKNVILAQKGLISEMRAVISDLTFLAKLNELWDLLDDPADEDARLNLAQEFLYFSEKKGIYDQIRFLSDNGMEIIRIDYDEGNPHILAQSELQNKSDRYYFQEALAQDIGGIYMSPFDLNVEEGEIEYPLRPAIRFATPLFNSRGEKKGVLMFNFRGEKLIQGFRQAAVSIADHLNLINNEGYWLSGPRPENEWAFLLEHEHSFAQTFPDAWQKILAQDTGSFVSKKGLFTFAIVYPMVSVLEFYAEAGMAEISSVSEGQQNAKPRFWKVISHVSPQALNATSQAFFRQHLLSYMLGGLFLLAGSLIVAQTATRRQQEQAQKNFERRYHDTLENMQLAAVTLNADGRITFCNDYLLSLTGWQQKEIIGQDWFDSCVIPKDRQRTRHAYTEIIAGDAPPHTVESHIMAKTGEPHLFAWTNTLSCGRFGDVTTLTSIGQDITQQRESEEQLRKLSRAVEQSYNSVMITDAQGIIEYINPRFTELTGYSTKEILGQTPRVLKSGETSDIDYHQLWEIIKQGNEWRGVFHNRKKNGKLYWEDTMISPIRNEQGEISHFLAIKEDITEHILLKQEVEERNQELARTQTLTAMGRMATMIAHDLRNPLSSIKMTLQIWGRRAEESWGEEAKEMKQISLDQVRYMENILADLLAFSRPDALTPEWLNINKLLDSAINTTQKTIQQYNAKIITDYQPQLPTIHGDATKLRQVFSNLIMNALESADNVNHIPNILISACVEMDNSTPSIRIDIHDNGGGIDPAQKDKLFEPFFTTHAKGTGLGLPIVKRILDQHHGRISLDTDENNGACARVILPIGPVEL